VSLYDWLLFLHVLAAFLLVAGVVAYGVVVLGGGGHAARRVLAPPAMALWNAGGIGVLVLGVALAIEVDAYAVWDGWILAAIVLWFVASAAGGHLSRVLRDDTAGSHTVDPRMLFAVMVVATAVLLADMIFKPGA
jgi:thiosulfate reductase cytochrome b subunit